MSRVLETEQRRPAGRFVGRGQLAREIAERKVELACNLFLRCRQRREPAIDRLLQRSRAGQRPFVQHRKREPEVVSGVCLPVLLSGWRATNAASSACIRASSRLIRTCSR